MICFSNMHVSLMIFTSIILLRLGASFYPSICVQRSEDYGSAKRPCVRMSVCLCVWLSTLYRPSSGIPGTRAL